MVLQEDDEDDDEPLPPPAPAPRPIISPGFGYYYPSRIYELRSGTPGFAAPGYNVAQAGPYGGRYYY